MIALLFTFCEKITLTEVTYVSKVLDHTLYQNLKVSGAVVAPFAHLQLWIVVNCSVSLGCPPHGAVLMSSFVNTGWLIQKLRGTQHSHLQAYTPLPTF